MSETGTYSEQPSSAPSMNWSSSSSQAGLERDALIAAASSAVPETAESKALSTYRIWQTEMESGFEKLVNAILPYVQDCLTHADIEDIGMGLGVGL